MEDIELNAGDYILPTFVSHFQKSWETAGDANEVIETFSLTAISNIQGMICSIHESGRDNGIGSIEHVGMR